MKYLIIAGLILLSGCSTTNLIHKYNVWVNIVYGSTFSDTWDCCAQLEEMKNGNYEQVVKLTIKKDKKYNEATYLFRAAYTKQQCKDVMLKKIAEWRKTIMKDPCTYRVEWNENYRKDN